jgi:hypothetical protein
MRSVLCTALVILLGIVVPAAQSQASPLSTDSLSQIGSASEARERVLAQFDREEVARGLERYGIDPLEARARVAALSDAEIGQIAGRLDQLPAGEGSTLGTVLLIIVVVFVGLVITDAMGLTDVFPWIRKPH